MVFLIVASLVFDPASLNPRVNPCEDFYAHACGGWEERNPIPADQASWTAYSKLADENNEKLKTLLEKTKTAPLADAYAACMDEPSIEAKSWNALKPLLESNDDLAVKLAELHKRGVDAFFTVVAQQDYRDATKWVGSFDQGGLGMPDRDYYFKSEHQGLRDDYVRFIAELLTLAGDAQPDAAGVMRVETALAKASMTSVQRMNSKNYDHWTTKMPYAFDMARYLIVRGVREQPGYNVTWPPFMQAFAAQAKSKDAAVYLRFHTLRAFAPMLGKRFVDAHFAFYGQKMRGIQSVEPRWKRCVRWVDEEMGELLGKDFVARYFPAEAKGKVRDMVVRIQLMMGQRIKALAWMSEATKVRALEKLERMQNKIGYPDKWRDYLGLDIRKDDYVGNTFNAEMFEDQRLMRRIGTKVERGEWALTPPTVNAYYDAQMNDMNFPAGVLLPPLYDAAGDEAANYGNTGATVGHELTHGFDSDGRQFDGAGNLKDWWTAADAAGFKQRAQCLVKQYAKYEPVEGVHLNGELTLGENIADLGGTIIAWEAWRAQAKVTPEAEQHFFLAYAQSFCSHVRDKDARVRAATDPHAPGKFRVNGVVANMPDFARVFSCAAPKRVCTVW